MAMLLAPHAAAGRCDFCGLTAAVMTALLPGRGDVGISAARIRTETVAGGSIAQQS